MIINDNDLKKIFKNRIIQENNCNANSEVFLYNNEILKIFLNNQKMIDHNLSVIKQLFDNYFELISIKELVLPKEYIFYNNKIVGYSMPYINGLSLHEIIENNSLYTSYMRLIFIRLLNMIENIKTSPFNFYIGDMHEKNIIVDKHLNPYIIDCDSFIINNNKLKINNTTIIGKYPNQYFNNDELKKINISSDYFCLFSIILNYSFKDIINYNNKPVEFIKNHSQFKSLNYIIERLNNINDFYITEDDINNIFKLKYNLKYKFNNNDEKIIKKELKRIRKI